MVAQKFERLNINVYLSSGTSSKRGQDSADTRELEILTVGAVEGNPKRIYGVDLLLGIVFDLSILDVC